MAEVKISAQPRTEFGKGAARRTRAADRVPGVVYGHGVDPLHVTLPAHDLLMALKTPNVLLRLKVEGGKDELVIPKAVQRHPIKIGVLEHVDLLLVQKGEKVTVEVPILTEGDLAPGGNLLEHLLNALPVETEATHIPESVTVSIAGLDAGATIHAKDITLPAGTTLAVEDDAAVLQVVAAQAEAPAEEGAEGEAGGAEA
ncbi:50S ribosomal protein L25/general stress protein Ctc [Streptomyces antimycoticus]|uniref:Large ribosomal subunit protein bL25 n=3 Tax=Streptomyces TaxID=1883 RepID=A0ABD5JK54_9ACTN|nr:MULTISPECIES: 50S ribosomal protein L25/general stress protein Ctc [Streptomyces]MEE4588289.1 50S ribosomal protein L25/general stress protein Ctc [Streptomyces sp. DSM 41602]AJZ82471.1 50S ribosomal protein L25/general stress protein Ctc [Streptomyces sp. AgN23]KUL59343.1 50S ribosomal protein L25 [Streptomyces violaceusniger]RSS33940.1 50S ribosomal protein L25/general stress protein Ctc [Streptomyces sp. WAC05858]WJD97624.1 50S ribosomal protein L25/general stress protein Ctc [Streptomyc